MVHVAMLALAALRQPKVELRNRSMQNTVIPVDASVRAIAARAYDELMASGIDQSVAARRVVAAVKAGRVVGHDRCTVVVLKQWHQQLRGDSGATVTEALEQHQSPFPTHIGVDTAARAAWLLDVLRNSPALRQGG